MASRYGDKAGVRYRSGTRRAIRRKQFLCTLLALAVCVGLGAFIYRKSVGVKVTEYAAREGVTPTEAPVQVVVNAQVGPYGMYLDKYKEGLSEDDMWMEDYEDNRERQRYFDMLAEVYYKELNARKMIIEARIRMDLARMKELEMLRKMVGASMPCRTKIVCSSGL